MRINQYLARSGLASRRKAEVYVLAGRVKINGQVIRSLSYQVRPEDRVEVDGDLLTLAQPVFYLFHKPAHCLASHQDPHEEHLIYAYLPKDPSLFSVGRLDFDSEGLLFITNQGSLAQAIAHPAHEMEKEYWVLLDRPFSLQDRSRLLQGVRYEGIFYQVDGVDQRFERSYPITGWNQAPVEQKLRLILHEGKKREVRRLLLALGYRVERLVRVRIGPLDLKGLKAGSFRPAKDIELALLKEWERSTQTDE